MTDTLRQHRDPVDRFRSAAREFPERTAVRGTDGVLTFAELEHRSAALAVELAARGIGRGDRVGVGVGRGCSLVVALLAIWRAGAAYVPLDPQHPADRLEFMVREAGIVLLLSGPSQGIALLDGAPLFDPACIPGSSESAGAAVPAGGIDAAASPLDPAYVIFTSGSTGWPKGVEVSRGGVAALLSGLEEAGAFDPDPAVAGWNASVSFDASVPQWARVCRGDTVVVLDEDDRKDPHRLAALVDRFEVTDLDLTPSHWEMLRVSLRAPRADGRTLRLLMGGEPVPPCTWSELAEAREHGGPQALNLYGPTECTVEVTCARIEGPAPHLGDALPGGRLHVLDETLREVPAGGEGELFIGGPQVALGYVNRPGLTAERFVADPFGGPGSRLYRTGDRVRRAADGTLEYLGRQDRQVKVRGFRVELGEVEAALSTAPGVARAVAVHDEGPAGERLLAYCVPADGAEAVLTQERLRTHATRLLPEYMMPSSIIALAVLPLTMNGKLDVSALPRPEAVAGPGAASGPTPFGEVEELIAAVWAEVLGRGDIGPDSDFFALGGHSLVALRVVGRLKRRQGVAISIRDVYRHPRLRDLAAYVHGLRAAVGASA